MTSMILGTPFAIDDARQAGAAFGLSSRGQGRIEFERHLVRRLCALEDLFGAMGSATDDTLVAFDEAAWENWEECRSA